MGNHHCWSILSLEGIHSVGCTIFVPTALSHIMTFVILHNTCCDLRLDSEFRFHREPSYICPNQVTHINILSPHPSTAWIDDFELPMILSIRK
jgi:hypothetical protein